MSDAGCRRGAVGAWLVATRRRLRHGSVALLAIAGSTALAPRPAQAQDSTCSYSACALRYEFRGLGGAVVAGREAVQVGRRGFARFTIPVLAQGPDSARVHYLLYRQEAPRAVVLSLLGTAMTAVGIALGEHSHNRHDDWTAIGLLGAGLGVTIAGEVHRARAANHLELAVWHYNGSLGR